MLSTVEDMEREEIEGFTDEQLLEFGKPILDVTENTIELPQKLLDAIDKQISELNLDMRELNKAQLESIKSRYSIALRNNINERPGIRKLNAKDIRRMLIAYYDSVHNDTLTLNALASEPTTLCESMFNQVGSSVYLYPGDNLDTANLVCSYGSTFWLTPGEYKYQQVQYSNAGNIWVGYGSSTILNGKGTTDSAFWSGMKNNSISFITIQNYKENGIYSTSSNSTGIDIHDVIFKNIAPSKDGESNGAVNLYYCQNVQARDSYFEDVASAILFTHCGGPLKANNNEALNPGRNFFQCNDCEGAGIRVNGNSLEHTTGYGNTLLEDWINIYDSEGTSGDYIQVNNNRARVILSNGQATKVNNSGCMVILGDAGGKYQEARNNIGVNPGNCGIGVADGQYINVRGNKMYSQEIPGLSNVGFYAIDFYDENNTTCRFINFYSGSNSADWMCASPEGNCDPQNPIENRADANGSCTDQNNSPITRTSLRNLIKNETLGSGIWNQ